MSLRSTVAALIAITAVSSPAAAQSAQRWSVQLSGIAVGVFGDAYQGLANGYGGELQVRLTPSLWSYGVGIQSSIHDLSEIAGQTVSLNGLFFEPRRVFDVGSAKYAPYLSARFSYLEQSADLTLQTGGAGQSILSANGFQGNVGGGMLVKLTPRVNLDIGLTLGAIRFGDATLTVDGQSAGSFTGTSGTGQNAVVRAGFAIGLGKGKAKPVAKPVAKPASGARPRR